MKPKKLPFEEFKSIYSRVPRLCVDCVIQNSDGILLTKRKIPPCIDQWHLPGGTVLFGESLEEALKRVVKEEVGLRVKIVKFLGMIDWVKNHTFGHTVSLVYLLKPTGGKLQGSKQAREVKFFQKIPQKTILEHQKFLKSYL